ncbi:DNA-processing protein DprA [Corynebacterium parakroppenstedtii]|uniref:DNA-processing protein DprA n=1 Tax=Corynebacterium parakroppenstedtii TaxID=2828363 RepID=UPI001C8F42CF|nr:DNA-processing protein DprA [Corynebacterium parakroppenstedtii]MBY0795012.1 DNA-protecting protein DprA [Corynebacterium parakroppenstedtii]
MERSRLDHLAHVLELTRTKLNLTQPERVAELITTGDATQVIADHGDYLPFPSETNSFEQCRADIADWDRRGFNIASILEPDYPHLLREVHESPALIYWTGDNKPNDIGISIVGSRHPTDAQARAAYDVARQLSEHDITVVSGLAQGIDAAAHSGALEVGGRTVAVMGTGLAHTYPRAHQELRKTIETHGGQIITQFEPDTPGAPFRFPMRNAVMSGFSVATLVMAATEKSGTRHQAKAAVGHGHPVIFPAGIAKTISWAKEMVDRGEAEVATSAHEAVHIALACIQRRRDSLSLFA